METNELRVGNYVYHGYQTPEGIAKIKTYHDICYVGFMYGIPITEEILLKCKGFTGSGERFEFENPNGHYAYALIFRHGVWNFYDTSEDYCIAQCSYLHELQNIYYWTLDKKELEVVL